MFSGTRKIWPITRSDKQFLKVYILNVLKQIGYSVLHYKKLYSLALDRFSQLTRFSNNTFPPLPRQSKNSASVQLPAP